MAVRPAPIHTRGHTRGHIRGHIRGRSTHVSEPQRNIDALLSEQRSFPPPQAFRDRAVVRDPAIYDAAGVDHEAFWAEQAGHLTWSRPWDAVMEQDAPWVTWFSGGRLNATVNCLDRHVEAGGGDKVAYLWEGEPGDAREITYAQLLEEVCRLANGLRSLGVRKGDRVNIYLGMIPELPIAMLACARIGAPHSVVFGGFSAEALRDRINDAQAKVLITADGAWRRGQVVPLKANADVAVRECPSIEHVITVRRCGNEHAFTDGRDHWYHELVAEQAPTCEPEELDAEDLLYLLYTSGTTGKPKGIVHTVGGYLTQVTATHRMIFDIHDDDVYWCAADIGWVTGHSYIVYGPLANHTTGIMYEGGRPVPANAGGYLVIRRPWPGIARTIWGDPDRYVQTYFGKYGPDVYVAGDGAKRDDDGYFWLLGRIDDVMNVAGHRLSTYEIESSLVDDPKVAEAAVVSKPDELVGEAIVAFVTLKSGYTGDDRMAEELRDHVATMIGKIARPHAIIFTDDLPKTRSGTI